MSSWEQPQKPHKIFSCSMYLMQATGTFPILALSGEGRVWLRFSAWPGMSGVSFARVYFALSAAGNFNLKMPNFCARVTTASALLVGFKSKSYNNTLNCSGERTDKLKITELKAECQIVKICNTLRKTQRHLVVLVRKWGALLFSDMEMKVKHNKKNF